MENTKKHNISGYGKIGFILIGIIPFLASISRSYFYIDLAIIFLVFIFIKIKFFSTVKIAYSPIISWLSIYFVVTIIINLLNYKLPYSHDYGDNIAIFFVTVVFLLIFKSFCFNFRNNLPLLLKTTFYGIAFINIVIILSFLTNTNIYMSLKTLKIVKFHYYFYHSAQSFYVMPIGIFIYYTLKKKNIINYTALISIIVATFISHGRTAILTMSAGILVFIIFYYWQKVKKIYITSFSIIILLVTLFAISYISSGSFTAIDDINTSLRVKGFITYIPYVIQRNILLGIGILGDNHMYALKILPFKHPHNIFVEAFVTMGLIGLFALLTLITRIFIYMIKLAGSYKNSIFSKPLLYSSMTTFIVSSQAFWSIWSKNHLVLVFFYLFLSIMTVKYIEQEKDI